MGAEYCPFCGEEFRYEDRAGQAGLTPLYICEHCHYQIEPRFIKAQPEMSNPPTARMGKQGEGMSIDPNSTLQHDRIARNAAVILAGYYGDQREGSIFSVKSHHVMRMMAIEDAIAIEHEVDEQLRKEGE